MRAQASIATAASGTIVAYKSQLRHLFNAQFEQGIGEAADVAVQLFIANMFALAGVVAFR